jgi:hypothetical protein
MESVEEACFVQRFLGGNVCPVTSLAEERDFGVVEVEQCLTVCIQVTPIRI